MVYLKSDKKFSEAGGEEDGIEKEGWGQIVEDLVYRTSKFGFYPEVSGSCEMFWQTAFPSNVLLIFSIGIMEYEGGRRKSAASQGRGGIPPLLVPVCATHLLAFHFQSIFPHPWKQCRGLHLCHGYLGLFCLWGCQIHPKPSTLSLLWPGAGIYKILGLCLQWSAFKA